jgi:phosphoglycerol transferase
MLGEHVNIKYLVITFLLDCVIIAAYYIGVQLKMNVRRSVPVIEPPPPTVLHPSRNITSSRYAKKTARVFVLLLLLISVWSAYFWFRKEFDTVSVEELMYYARMPLGGANWSIVIRCIGDIILFPLLLALSLVNIGKFEIYKNNRLLFKNCINYYAYTAAHILLGASVIFLLIKVNIFSFIKRQFEPPALFYEENYINPKDITFTFPEKKRNLIVIFIESLETGFLNSEQGGAFSENIISEVTELAQNNINFSHTGLIGGARQIYGTGWTIGGIVSTYTGIPLAFPINGNNYGKLPDFLPNITSIGDILSENEYNNYYILGSDSGFAGRDKYFRTHGNTTIWDYGYFQNKGYIDKDYFVWWGFEDRKLYRFAKSKLSEIARDDAPFFFTLLTVDTHPTDGYLDEFAARKYSSKYKNVLADMSKQLGDFIDWIRQQDFYDNTTIAILGDHLYMDSAVFQNEQKITDRYPLNIFMNSTLDAEYTKNRAFTQFDLFPTIIDSIGGEYNAGGIGLGRSMNKGEKTLIELLGREQFESSLKQKSIIYESFLYQ